MSDDRYTEAEAAYLDISQDAPEEIEEARREREIEANYRRQFIITQMGNRAFRAWIMDWLNKQGTFQNAFGYGPGPTNFPDPLATWFAAGRKSAGWDLWEEIDAVAPELASLMRRESVTTPENKPGPPRPVLVADEDDAEFVP